MLTKKTLLMRTNLLLQLKYNINKDMNKKTLICRTALKIFAKNGFEKTSVDEIALKAKIAKGTIYYHFKSKDDIFLSLIDTGISDFVENINKELLDIKKPKEKLEKLIATQLNFFEKYRDFCEVLLAEFWRMETIWKKDINKIQEQYISVIREIVIEGQESGDFRKELDVQATTTALFSLIAVSGLSWAVLHKEVSRETMHQTVSTIFLKGIIA